MPGLNVVALISGGKDSFFSILHCQANGHQVVALANLHPPHDDGSEAVADMESFMYQTIGHAVIPLYSEALGLPIYRQEITGAAINQSRDYGHMEIATTDIEDETEALVPLLRKVMVAHHKVNAVSTGAILSDYQRTRVESVAIRLGLTPLSYLWQWPRLPPQVQTSLLEDMAAVGQDSRIIKVASGGLDDSFLWQNVAESQTISRLAKAMQRFGSPDDGAVLGEGGEFETLAVAGPAPLWKGRISVPSDGVVAIAGEAGSATVEVKQPSVTPNDGSQAQSSSLRLPPLLDARFQSMLQDFLSTPASQLCIGRTDPSPGLSNDHERNTGQCAKTSVVLHNLLGDGQSAAEQTRSIMDHALLQLANLGHTTNEIAYSTIILREMSDFTAVNAIYGGYFALPNPPARVTIACADVLPSKARLTISLTSVTGSREGLHVQSRSYWAPANIGPYSQAISFSANVDPAIQGSVFIAGQIPLVPATMELVVSPSRTPNDDFTYQTILALQHLVRIGSRMKVNHWVGAIAFVTLSQNDDRLGVVPHAWEILHKKGSSDAAIDESEDFDVWDLKHGAGSAAWQAYRSHESELIKEDSASGHVPPLYIVQVDSLPRGADIEWVGFGQTSQDQGGFPLQLRNLLETFRELAPERLTEQQGGE